MYRLCCFLLLLTIAPVAQAAFLDVPSGHPNATAITYLNNNGVVSGYANGTFDPSKAVNRAELMKMLVEGQGITPNETVYKNCFPDVQADWFAKYVCYAKEQNWVSGYPDGTFKPGRTVADVEALKMILNARDASIVDEVEEQPFRDIAINEWFAPYITTAKQLNILEESGSNFTPGKAMTRAGVSENIFRTIALTEAGTETFDPAAALAILNVPMTRADGSTYVAASSSSASSETVSISTIINDAPLVAASSESSQSSEVVTEEETEPSMVKEPITLTSSAESDISFTGGKNGVPLHDGMFKDFTLTVFLPSGDGNNAEGGKINLEILIGSMETDTSGLTSHLLSNDFFSASEFPTATFVSSSIKKQAGTVHLVTGELTIKGVTRVITIPVNIDENSLEMTYDLNRIDFGIGSPDDGIDQVVPLQVKAQLQS